MLTAKDIEKQLRPKEAGASDGKRDFPSANASAYSSKTETDIIALCEEEIGLEQDRLAHSISDTRNKVSAIRKSIPDDVDNLSSAIGAKLRAVLLRHADTVGKSAAELERRAKDFRQFRVLNDITYEPDYNDSVVDLIGVAIFLVAIESAGNAFFFGQASEAGYVGGFFTAAMISLGNVAMGFIAGVFALRQFNHVKKWRLLFALPILVILLVSAFVFNLIVGHYREALIKNPDAIIIDIIPDAMNNLLNIRSLESIILVLLGLCIFFYSMYKGFKVWDTYPGYMSKHRKMKDAEEYLVRARNDANKQVDKELGEEIARFQNIGPFLKKQRSALEHLAQAMDRTVHTFNGAVDQIEHVGGVNVKTYRDANLRVRNPQKKPPAYFSTKFELNRNFDTHDLDIARSEIASLTETLVAADNAFNVAQRKLMEDRVSILNKLEDALAQAETNAKAKTRSEIEEENESKRRLGKL